MPDRPVLLLDVDGVINCFGGSWTREYQLAHFDLFRAYGLPIRMPKGAPQRVARLADVFEMHWATMWMERAHERLSGPLGIADGPAWPAVDFSSIGADRQTSAKLSLVAAYAAQFAGRGLAWVDDRAGSDAQAWATARNARGAPTFVIAPDPTVGLTDEHVERLVRYFTPAP